MPSKSTTLPPLTQLFEERQKEIIHIINNLQYHEIDTHEKFEAIVTRLTQRFVLNPVTIGNARLSRHRSETKDEPSNYNNLWGGPVNYFIVTVEFPFEGSSELFNYKSSEPLTIGQVHTPTKSVIEVEVQLHQLDKTAAITDANTQMRITKELIRLNNPTVKQWSDSIVIQLRKLLSEKQNELREFYS